MDCELKKRALDLCRTVCVYIASANYYILCMVQSAESAIKMLIFAVVIASFTIVLSSAQPTAISSVQCNATYNGIPESCRDASTALYMGTATADQRMMTCSAGHMCYGLLQIVMHDCSNTVRNS